MIILVRKAEQYDPDLVRCSNIRPLQPQGRFGDPVRKEVVTIDGESVYEAVDRRLAQRTKGRIA
jgi:hypothetical protein